jgi:hypothetical protein
MVFICIFHICSHSPEPIGVEGRLFGVLGGRVRAFRRQRGNRVGHGLFSTEKQHLGSSPPYGCVFFLSNNASNRQVSHSKEGRTSQARYTFINLGNLRPSLFSSHAYLSLDLSLLLHLSNSHTYSQWPPHYPPPTASTTAPMALMESPRSLSRLVSPAC